MPPRPRLQALAIALALLTLYLVWGSTYLAIKIGLEGFPPFLMGAIRMAAAGGLLYLALRWRGVPPPTRAQWRSLALLGLWMVLLANGLVNVAEQQVASGLAAIAVASMPLWAGLFAAMRGRHPSRLEWTGLAVGFAGVAWLNAGSELSASPLGLVCLLVAPIAWAWGSMVTMGRDLPDPFMTAAGQMLAGAAMMLVVGLALGERIEAMPGPRAWGAVAYLALFGSILAFSAYAWLLRAVRPAVATSYAYVNPPVAVLLGVGLGGETLGADSLAAMAVILAGVGLITLSRARLSRAAPR